MIVQGQIKEFITCQPEPKRSDMHRIILKIMKPDKLWFLDGKNSENKSVYNPYLKLHWTEVMTCDGAQLKEEKLNDN